MKKTFLLTLLVALYLVACKKKNPETGPTTTTSATPLACFDTVKLTIPIHQQVSFRSCSKDARHLEWSFGDGDSSTAAETSHSYSSPGKYTVTLKVYNADRSKWDVAHKEIVVGYLYITKIIATEVPPIYNDGAGDPADIFFAFVSGNTIVSKTQTHENTIIPASWTMDWKLNPGEQVGFAFYEEDSNSVERILYQEFDPYQTQYTTLNDTNTFVKGKIEYSIK